MLQIRALTHVYGNGTRALDSVDLSVPTGVFGLLGPNGAGKSTLMRCITTLQTPTSGSIRFAEIDVIAEPERLRRTLGYLPQEFGVYPRIGAYDLLDHLAVLKGVTDRALRRDTVERLLAQVNLWTVRSKALASLSGGQRRRFGVAQALIGAPRLIVVDEPTAGLDPEERNRLLDLIAEVGESVVVILSTHIVEDVTDLCPRMAVLAAGRIRLQGAPDALIASLRGRVWRKVIAKAELDEHRAQHHVISARLLAGRTLIHVLADQAPGPGFEPTPAGLEDVYFSTLRAGAEGSC